MLLKHSGQGNVVTQFCQTNLHLTLRRRIKDDLSEMPGFLSGGLPFESVVKWACLVLGLGKCFTRTCLPILIGGMSQKLFKITIPKGDIFVNTRNWCVWHVFHRQRSFLINEWYIIVKGVKFLSRLLNVSCSDVITVPLFFSLPTKPPRPLSSFETHTRWQPVTQSARSRRSYGKIEDCEQSIEMLQFRLMCNLWIGEGMENWRRGGGCRRGANPTMRVIKKKS